MKKDSDEANQGPKQTIEGSRQYEHHPRSPEHHVLCESIETETLLKEREEDPFINCPSTVDDRVNELLSQNESQQESDGKTGNQKNLRK